MSDAKLRAELASSSAVVSFVDRKGYQDNGIPPQSLKARDRADGVRRDVGYLVRHSGQSLNANCVEVKNVDEECVNKELEIGKSTGRWWPWNNCNTFAAAVLWKCRINKDICELSLPQRHHYFE